ncbi:unnamed protein product [Brassica oleracea var. botrytis]
MTTIYNYRTKKQRGSKARERRLGKLVPSSGEHR